jgi:hypothetical protein
MPRITVEVSDRSLKALTVSLYAFQNHYHMPVPADRDHIYQQEPAQVITLVDMGDGSYRLGGEFLGEYIDKQTGEVVVNRATPPREPVDLGPHNFQSVANRDPWNGGENNIN